MTKKVHIIIHSMVAAVLLTLLIVASFYDEIIASTIYIGSGISYIGAVIGKLPSWIFLSFAGSVLLRLAYIKDKTSKARIPLMLLYAAIVVFGSYMMGHALVSDVVEGKMSYVIACIICVFASAASILVTFKIDIAHIKCLKKWAILAIIAIALIYSAAGGVKIFWGRERYIDIIVGEGTFSPWYKPNWFGGGSSMPSGHTALACGMLLLPMMFQSIPAIKPYAPGLYILSIIFIVFIATTRMLGGYHFLSDILASILLGHTAIFTTYYIGFGRDLSGTEVRAGSWLNKL